MGRVYIMTEHKVCVGCKWNEYPLCKGSIMLDGNYMNIDKLHEEFQCGVKLRDTPKDHSIIEKSKIELLEDRIKVLEDAKKG